MASSFVLPDFFAKCPYTLRVSPHRDTLTRKSQEWILSQAKLSPERQAKFLQTEAGVLTAYCYPDADYSRLQVISDWMEWVICIDDWTDEFDEKETESLGSCIMNCLHDPHGYQTDKAAGRLIKDYSTRFLEDSKPNCARRFVEAMDLFMKAVAEQAAHRQKGHTPDMESYISLRRDSSASRPCYVLIEYANRIDLPDEVIEYPLIRSMEHAINDWASWTNDIFSYKKEHALGDTHNLICVIMKERDLELQPAMKVAEELCMKCIQDFERDRTALPSWGPEIDRQVKVYVQGLQEWIVGSLYWSFACKRYFGAEGEAVKQNRTLNLLTPKKELRAQNSM